MWPRNRPSTRAWPLPLFLYRGYWESPRGEAVLLEMLPGSPDSGEAPDEQRRDHADFMLRLPICIVLTSTNYTCPGSADRGRWPIMPCSTCKCGPVWAPRSPTWIP